MSFRTTVCGVRASLVMCVAVVLAAFGQARAVQKPAAQTVAVEGAPSPAAAMSAYRAVNEWVRAWAADVPAREIAGLSGGAHVQLRLDGALVGRGQSFPSPGEAGVAALLRATREAMAEASTRMILPNDANREAAAREQASRMMISVDLAGPLIAFEPTTWAEAELTLSPGLDGVAASIAGEQGVGGIGGAGKLAAAFPSMLIATGTLPHSVLSGVSAQAVGEGGAAAALDEPRQLRARHGVRMYKFRTTHLAQCKPGAEPVFLYRGARLIDQSEMSAAELRKMAEGMAGHLRSRLGAGLAEFGQETAALASLSLRRHANERGGLRSASEKASGAFADRIVHSFSGEPTRIEPASALMLLLTESCTFSGLDLSAECGVPWMRRHSALKNRIAGASPDSADLFRDLPEDQKGLGAVVYSVYPKMAMRLESVNDESTAVVSVDSSVRRVFATCGGGRLVSHMPWLGWAEIELAKHKDAGADGKPADIPSAVALREMRAQVWEHQIVPADLDADSLDLAGGIVFTRAASPLPTWQCARPLAFIATMLRDERLTEPWERDAELGRLMQSLRFLRQLQADESIGWMAPNVEMAVGGVRAAPWDQSMPPDATSMALLTVVEVLRSLDALSAGAAKEEAETGPAPTP